MKKIFRSIFGSPEIYVFLISVALSLPFFNFYSRINSLIFPTINTEIPYITIIALFSITISPTLLMAYKIIFPDENYKYYVEWEGYKIVVFICKYAVIYQFVGLVAFIILIAQKDVMHDYFRYTISIYLSLLVSLVTLTNAFVSLKILLRKYEE